MTSASRYNPRYQRRSSMCIRGLIPLNFAELTKSVPSDVDTEILSGTEGLTFGLKVSEYDQEIPQSHTTDQLTALCMRKTNTTVSHMTSKDNRHILCNFIYWLI